MEVPPFKPEIDVSPTTLREVLDAIEGYRNQLATFSDQSLSEIAALRRWIIQVMDEMPSGRIGLIKFPRPPPKP